MFNRNILILCFLMQLIFSSIHQLSDSELNLHLKSIIKDGSEAVKNENIQPDLKLELKGVIKEAENRGLHQNGNAAKDYEVV